MLSLLLLSSLSVLCLFQVLIDSSFCLSRKETAEALIEITGMDATLPSFEKVQTKLFMQEKNSSMSALAMLDVNQLQLVYIKEGLTFFLDIASLSCWDCFCFDYLVCIKISPY